MDEKTSDLRDIFVETTGTEGVTEQQAAARGTLTDRDVAAADERVRELVAAMRERYGFSTDLDDATYARIAHARFEEPDDKAIASSLGTEGETVDISSEVVRDARLDLHLIRQSDREVDEDAFAYEAVKQLTAEGASIIKCADALDADPDTVAKYARVARVDLTSTRANDRFGDEFRDLLTDADMERSHAATAREDGLEEATEDIETDVSL